MEAELRERWERLVLPLGVDDAEAAAALGELRRRYAEPHRAFHTLSHVRHVLDVVGFLRGHEAVDDPIAVELAVWFHDAVYEPGSEDNEAASARLAGETLVGWEFDDARVAQVVDLVLATKDHTPDVTDAPVLIDADLAVLASPPEAYDVYHRALRVEYGQLDESDWRAGRAEFLRSMLDRQSIFTTPTMRQRGEPVARRNLADELERLEAA
jgi:predicted metal-dependent HD superfamily phosphohydrolase